MPKSAAYRDTLSHLADWDVYLQAESGLPGPRANLELAQAVADLGRPEQFRRWLALDAAAAPANTPAEFFPLCGAVGLGRLLAEGDLGALAELRGHANDPRWRLREGVTMALQRWGETDMGALIGAMKGWSRGAWLEQRAVAAAVCEPRLLKDGRHVPAVLRLLDGITSGLARADAASRKSAGFKTLRRALGFCWSVAVAAAPTAGQPAMEQWLASADPDVRWAMQANLKTIRLARLDPAWVRRWQKAA